MSPMLHLPDLCKITEHLQEIHSVGVRIRSDVLKSLSYLCCRRHLIVICSYRPFKAGSVSKSVQLLQMNLSSWLPSIQLQTSVIFPDLSVNFLLMQTLSGQRLAPVQFAKHQYTQVFFYKDDFFLVTSQPLLVYGIMPFQMRTLKLSLLNFTNFHHQISLAHQDLFER